jgi:beta-galactosidase/beta-glucuronidase
MNAPVTPVAPPHPAVVAPDLPGLWALSNDGHAHSMSEAAMDSLKDSEIIACRIGVEAHCEDAAWRLKLCAEKPAFIVSIEADIPGRFSDNAFTLFPGHEAEIAFTPEFAGATPAFTVRDLHSATCGPS